MKVLHVIPSLSPTEGGPSKALPLMASALREQGISITVATTDDAGPGRRLKPPVELPQKEHFGTVWRFPKQTDFYKVSLPCKRWLKQNIRSFDVVHVHALFSYTSVYAAAIARDNGVPYIIRPLGVLNTYGISQRRRLLKLLSIHFLEGKLLRDAAAIHFTSDSEKKEVEKLGISLNSAIVPLGIPIDAYLEKPSDISESKPYMLFLSRIDPKKNLESLLTAWSKLPNEVRENWNLRIAGSGRSDYISALKQHCELQGISDSILWEGYVEGAKKNTLLSRASAFALPSYSENFGIAAVEAMGSGLPCLLGEGVAVGVEADSVGACILTPHDADSILVQMSELLTNKKLRDSLGKNARKFSKENYSVDMMAEALIKLYKNVSHHPI